AAAARGAVHLGVQEVGGDDVVSLELPAVERLAHGSGLGFVDEDLQCRRGIQVDEHQPSLVPRRSSRISRLLALEARGSASTSMLSACDTLPALRSISRGELEYGTRRATGRP